MDIDALAKDFARFKPMLEEMLVGYKEYQAEKAARLAEDAVVDEALHLEIHAPLHESDEALAARAEQAKASDLVAKEQADAAQAELDEANAKLQAEADAQTEAARLQAEANAKAEDERLKAEADAAQAEIDRKVAEAAKNAAAAGQNQGQDAGNAPEGGKAPESAGEASQGAPLAEQAAREGANEHGLGPDTDGGPNPDYVAPVAEGQPKVPEEQPKG